jgi:methionyl-tRNA formyltransferase
MNGMKVVFIGASKFGMHCLKKILSIKGCHVVGIITNPSTFAISYRPEGVTNVLHTDFHPFAEEHNIEVYVMQNKMTEPLLLEHIISWRPDFILVAGWYHMVPKNIRAIAPTAGLHASLLPEYSGGSPLVWAIINNEQNTGISFFMLGDGVDNGPLIGQKAVPIFLNDSIATLYERIEKFGLELLEEFLPKIAIGEIKLTSQDESKRRIMPQRHPEDGEINWNWSALRIYNFIRAQTKPYPGAFTYFNNEKLLIWEAKFFDYLGHIEGALQPQGGEILGLVHEGPLQGLLVATANGDHPLLLTKVGFKGELLSGIEFWKSENIRKGNIFLRADSSEML